MLHYEHTERDTLKATYQHHIPTSHTNISLSDISFILSTTLPILSFDKTKRNIWRIEIYFEVTRDWYLSRSDRHRLWCRLWCRIPKGMLSLRRLSTSHFAIPMALLYGWLPLSSHAGASRARRPRPWIRNGALHLRRRSGAKPYETSLRDYEAAFQAYETRLSASTKTKTKTKTKISAFSAISARPST